MPSAFLSALLLSLSVSSIAAAPAGLGTSYSNSSQPSNILVTESSNNARIPQFAIDACKRMSTCRLIDGVPTLNQGANGNKHKSLSKIEANGSSSQTTGGDGNDRNTYTVDVGTTITNTGLCDPGLFFDMLLKRSNCGIGDTSVKCSGVAEYNCDYHDAQNGDFKIPAAPTTDPNWLYQKGAIDTCKMSFQAHFDSNAPLVAGVAPNSTYADYVKNLAASTLKAWATVPQGNVSQPLTTWDRLPYKPFSQLGRNFTFYQIPSKIEWYGVHGAGLGGDTSDNHHFVDMVMNIDCPVIKDNIGCDILPTLFGTILNYFPLGLGSIVSGASAAISSSICGPA